MGLITGLVYTFLVILGIVLFFGVFVWLHNISLNIYKIYTMLQEWDYDRKEKLKKEDK